MALDPPLKVELKKIVLCSQCLHESMQGVGKLLTHSDLDLLFPKTNALLKCKAKSNNTTEPSDKYAFG